MNDRDVELLRLLAARRPVESTVCGASMGAALPDGSRIRIRSFEAGREPQPGEVVALVDGPRVVVHRVRYRGTSMRSRGYVITQGDGNWLCDPPVRLDSVAGLVERYCPDEQWLPVAPGGASKAYSLFSRIGLGILSSVLEAHPPSAMELARVVSFTRMRAQALGRRFSRDAAGVRG